MSIPSLRLAVHHLENNNKSLVWFRFVFFIVIFLIFGYFISGQVFLVSDSPDMGNICESMTGKWEYVNPDGSRTEFDFPGTIETKIGETVVAETRLPDFPVGTTVFCIQSVRQDMEILIDGESRLSYSTADTRLFGTKSAVVFLFLPVVQEDSGKTLTVRFVSDAETQTFYRAYYGTRFGIWQNFVGIFGAELIIAIITLVLSIIVIVVSIAMSVVYKRAIELQFLGWGVCFAAFWVVVNSTFRQIIFPNISTVSDMAFLLVMTLLFPFIIYFNRVQNGRYYKAFTFAAVIDTVNFVVCVILHITGTLDFSYSIRFTAIVTVAVIIVFAVTMILDIINKKITEYRLIAIGVFAAFSTAMAQFAVYFISSSDFSGSLLAVGLSILLICAIINSLKDIIGIEKEKQRALLASEAKGKFLANMSHEIRTPISAVLGFNTMILRESREPNIIDYSSNIERAGQTLLALINDILDLSKIESGKMEIVPQEYSFASLIRDVLNMVNIKAAEKGLEIKISIDETIPSGMYGDEVRIRQIFVNLMNNAVKYTEKGSVTLSISGSTEDDTVVLHCAVIDTGIGIKDEDKKRLFAEYARIEEMGNHKIEGTGLGMSITVQLLAMMGSSLSVESVYGEGSAFSFDLRQKIIDSSAVGIIERRSSVRVENAGDEFNFVAENAKILVVDDNLVNRKVFIGLLKKHKMDIEQADGGASALDMIFAKKYDIIFLDHMMPEIDGIEVFKTMKSRHDYPNEDTPVIILTANAVSGVKEEYLDMGFNDYLSKPIIPEKLDKLIYNYLSADGKIDTAAESQKNEPTVPERKYPEVSGIDWGISRLKLNDDSLIEETVRNFCMTGKNEAVKLSEFYESIINCADSVSDEDFRQYRIKVHSMKTTSILLGSLDNYASAKILEKAADEKNTAVIISLHQSFIDSWNDLRMRLETAFGLKKERTGGRKMSKEDFFEKLGTLSAALSELDIDTADKIAKEFDDYSFSSAVEEKLSELSAAVCALDSSAADKIIEEITASGEVEE